MGKRLSSTVCRALFGVFGVRTVLGFRGFCSDRKSSLEHGALLRSSVASRGFVKFLSRDLTHGKAMGPYQTPNTDRCNFRRAWPRWLMRSFSSGVNSAREQPSSGTWKMGS